MDIHVRIKDRRLALGLTLQALATMVGVKWQTVQRWEQPEGRGGTAPARGRLKKVAQALQTTGEWLVSGITLTNEEFCRRYAFIPLYALDEKIEPMPYHDEVATVHDADNTYAYRLDYLDKKGLVAGNCRVVIAPDNCMLLGEQLLIDITDLIIQSGMVYVIQSKGGIRVRKIFPRFDGMLTMRAESPGVPEEVAPPEKLTIIGRVVGFTG